MKSREKIIRAMAENPTITTRELADIVGLSVKGVEKVIRVLKAEGVLKRIGPDKGGHWEVLK